jgi:hypothetical protein
MKLKIHIYPFFLKILGAGNSQGKAHGMGFSLLRRYPEKVIF